jgi:hypothetical protein
MDAMKRMILWLSVLLAMAGTAPASAAFLGANPRLGESLLNTGIEQVAGDVSLERLPGSSGAWLRRASEFFVAPGAGATAEAVNLKAIGQLEGATPAQVGTRLRNVGFEPVETYPGRNGATNTIWRHPATGEEVHISPSGDLNAPPGSAGAAPHVNKYGPANTHNRPLNDLNEPIFKTSPKKTPEFHVPLNTSSGGPF